MDKRLSGVYQIDFSSMKMKLHTEKNFDIVAKELMIGKRSACLFFVDGLVKDEVMEKVLEFLMSVQEKEEKSIKTSDEFSRRFLSYIETDVQGDTEKICASVLSGTLALVVDRLDKAIMIDARIYPSRNPSEPEDDRVLRGSRDGFIETLIANTAMVRRRIRDTALTMESLTVGSDSKTDVVLCYIEGIADKKRVDIIRSKIKAVTIPALTMGQESLAECIIKKGRYNPFAKIRFTERPDCASAGLLEGKIIVIIDNTPAVMILPTGFIDFIQDTNDYYFPPVVASYFRVTKALICLLTIFLTPTWYLLMKNPGYLPEWLSFLVVEEPNSVPILAQLLIVEIVIDTIKFASLNTPSALGNSFSVIGALVLGEFAIQAKWFVPEVVLFMAFTSISNYTQTSFDLGYAFKFTRIMLLILTGIFNIWGYIAGLTIFLIVLGTTPTVTEESYLSPIIPFNGKEFKRLILRMRINKDNS